MFPVRLFIIIFAFFCFITAPIVGLAQPDYVIPLNKPAKYKNKILRSEKSDEKRFTISKRLYQGMVTHYNYYYNANLKIDNIIAKAKLAHRDEFTELLPFYNFSPETTSADSIELDSIVYKASAGIVLHDLRNSYIDNLYLLAGRAFFYWQKFDSAYRIFQFVNYRFFPKAKEDYQIVVGGNKRSTKGELNISTLEKKGVVRKVFSKPPSRNDALLWIARTYAQDSLLPEAAALCHLLKKDKFFPKRLHSSLDEVLAYVYYQQQQWDSTVFYLTKALPNASNKTDLARWEYLLGQLHSKLDHHTEAAGYFAKAKKHTPDPVLHIHARIHEAQIVRSRKGNDFESTYDELIKLAKKERFDGFEDVLFFAAASLALDQKDSSKAIGLLKKSAKFNTENSDLKNKTFIKLAEIYFKQKNYTLSSAAYDSVDLAQDPSSPLIIHLENRKKILKDLVQYIQIVEQQDSLQRIAKMNDKERFLYLRKLLKMLRKQRGIRDNDSDISYTPASNTDMNLSSNSSPDQSIFIQAANTGAWYFNNNSQKSKGYTEFKSKWGKRPNVDNWRRQSSIDAMATQQSFNPGNPGGIGGDVDQVNTNTSSAGGVTPVQQDEQELSIASLESDLPLTDTLMSLSNKKIEEALLKQAWIYKNQLEDYPQEILTLEELLKRFPATKNEEEVLGSLIYSSKRTGNTAEQTRYTNTVNSKYPDGEIVKKLSGRQSDKNKENPDLAYEEIFKLFQSGNYRIATEAKRKADSVYGNKYWTPQLLYIEAVGYANLQEDSIALKTLSYIETNFAGSAMEGKAATLKSVILRRKEIEDYLTNTNISRNNENKLETPYEEPPTIHPLFEPYHIKKTSPPVTNYRPAQIVNLQKPKPGIEIIKHVFEKNNITYIAPPILKAGKDSIRIRPLKEVFIDMVYIYNPSEPYYMLVVFEDIDPIYRSEAKISFQRYNNKARGAEDIQAQLYEAKEGPHWLEIGTFPAMASSLGYYDEVSANIKSIIPWLGSDKYQIIIISDKNLETLKSRKDISEYLLFIRQYIKGKF
jgi:tetratricopeptide (TPR) repeat protein